MQMELKACFGEIDWMIRCHNYEAFNFPQEEYPSRPLPIPPDYIVNLQSRLVKVKKGILPPTLKMILKTSYHLPARQAPITSPTVQPDDTMGDIGTGSTTHWSDHEPWRKRKMWLQTAPRAQIRGEILFLKPRSGWTTKHHKSPLAISKWRWFGSNKGQQRREQIGVETTPIQGDFAGNPETVTAA